MPRAAIFAAAAYAALASTQPRSAAAAGRAKQLPPRAPRPPEATPAALAAAPSRTPPERHPPTRPRARSVSDHARWATQELACAPSSISCAQQQALAAARGGPRRLACRCAAGRAPMVQRAARRARACSPAHSRAAAAAADPVSPRLWRRWWHALVLCVVPPPPRAQWLAPTRASRPRTRRRPSRAWTAAARAW